MLAQVPAAGQRPCARPYDLSDAQDCADLYRGLVSLLQAPLLEHVATLRTARDVHEWLASTLFCARDTSVRDALALAYGTAARLGPRMCAAPAPAALPADALPWHRAARHLQYAFATEFWTRNAAVLRRVATAGVATAGGTVATEPLAHDDERQPRHGWDGGGLAATLAQGATLEPTAWDQHGPAARDHEPVREPHGPPVPPAQEGVGGAVKWCHVHVTSDTWQAALQRRHCQHSRRAPATVLVEWDMRESARPQGDSLTATSDAMRCCTLGAADDGDGLVQPSSPADRCAVAGLQPDALVTREVCCTWGDGFPRAAHPDADSLHAFGDAVAFDAARFQPPTYDHARPHLWASAVRRVVRKFLLAAARRGVGAVLLPMFACHLPPRGGPTQVLVSVYAAALQDTLGRFQEVLVCTGDPRCTLAVQTELQTALRADSRRIVWTGDESRSVRRCAHDGRCTQPWCTDVHLRPLAASSTGAAPVLEL